MIYIISGLVAVIALSILATVQSRLELAEDFRAGALSIARAVILVSLAALWLIYQPGSMSAGVWLAVAIIAIWLFQQIIGRMLGATKLAERFGLRAEAFVTWCAKTISPIRLVIPAVAEAYEQELLDSVEEFSETVVREVMVPRVDMEVVDSDALLQDALSTFIASGYSRLPVVGEDVDDVLGVLYLKDLARVVHKDPALLGSKKAVEASRPALFTPESKSVAELLQEMQKASTQIAVVVDEYGGVAGIVTVEDLIEELVGEIGDEYDREDIGIESLADGSYRMHPRTTLDEVSELLQIELSDDDVDTVGGLLVKAIGELPVGGEEVEIAEIWLKAERVVAKKGQLLSVLVRKIETVE